MTDIDLEAEYRNSVGDLSRLIEINEALKKRHTDAAFDLQLQVVRSMSACRKVDAANKPLPPQSPRRWLSGFLSARKLRQPDGRPIHRYRMTDPEFQEARELLRLEAKDGGLAEQESGAGQLFVVFCAEWFRRESKSMFLQWDELAPGVLPPLPYKTRTGLSEDGLLYWKRPLLKSKVGREFLLSVAMEGGIPVSVIAEGARGWLGQYLRSVMRFALSNDRETDIKGFAHDESYVLRKSYRQDLFVDLCADLVIQLAKLRRHAASEAPAGMDTLTFINATKPGWRDDLPIYMPQDQEAAARALLNGLLTEKAGLISNAGISAARFLRFVSDGWRTALGLSATGNLAPNRLQSISAHSRWRAVPSGELANYLPSQLALFEPPGDDEKSWRVRPLADLSKLLLDFPFEARVTANLTALHTVVPFDWPGGDRVTSDVLVFREEIRGGGDQPELLKLVKSGSATLPDEKLYVLVPGSWFAEAGDDKGLGRSWSVSEGTRTLWEVLGTAYFILEGDEKGNRFRVEAGREERAASLEIAGHQSSSINALQEMDIFEGSIQFTIVEDGKSRPSRPTELFYRYAGQPWRPVSGKSFTAAGTIEISWRDEKAGIQLERRKLAMVPEGSSAKAQMSDGTSGRVILQNLPGWDLRLQSQSLRAVEKDRLGDYHFVFAARPMYRLEAMLRSPAGNSIEVCFQVVGKEAALLRANGEVITAGQTLDVASLRGGLAVSSHTSTMVISKHLSKSRAITMEVDGEYPLAALKPAIEEVMASMGDQDAQLDLEFLGESRTPIRLKKYRIDRPIILDGTIHFSQTATGTALAKIIMSPDHEHLLQTVDGVTFTLPDWCFGPCLVYLRDGPDVISRPRVVDAADNGLSQATTPLMRAIATTDYFDRRVALDSALDGLIRPSALGTDIRFLINLIAGLDGLPAASLDVLDGLAGKPKVLIRLLLNAGTESLQAMWNLQLQLPFLWLALPLNDWKQILQLDWDELNASFAALEPAMRTQLAMEHFTNSCGAISAIEPAMEAVFQATGFRHRTTSEASLADVISAFIRDQRNLGEDDGRPYVKPTSDPVAKILLSSGLKQPTEFLKFSVEEFDGLVVPATLAAQMLGLLEIDPDTEIQLRRTLREHPNYVSRAFPHFLRFYGV